MPGDAVFFRKFKKMFLTREEIKQLTGYCRPTAQIGWLKAEEFKFKIAADGRPRVLKTEVEFQMGHGNAILKKNTMNNPDIEGLKKWAEKGK
jgi:hypothetical protein